MADKCLQNQRCMTYLSYVRVPLISFLSVEVYTETLLPSRSFGFTNARTHKLRVLPYIYSLLLLLNFVHPVTYVYKAVPLEAWSGPEFSRKLKFTDYMTTAQNGGKVDSLTHRPPLPPGNVPGTHFC